MCRDENVSFGPRQPVFIMTAQELSKLNLSEDVIRDLLAQQLDLAQKISEEEVAYCIKVRDILGLKKSY
ncbi:MAG: hypothetical protein WCD55_13875 [Bacteroidales bacterium]